MLVSWITFILLLVISTSISANLFGTEIVGSPGTDGDCSSFSFPSPYSIEGHVYKFNFTCTDYGCSVKLVFQDFDLHENSELKIIDGNYMSDPTSRWRQGKRPFFMSNSKNLIVIFKPGKSEGSVENRHIGFKLTYYFLTSFHNRRSDWAWTSLPASGVCRQPEVTDSGGGEVVQRRVLLDNRLVPVDCVWHLDFDSSVYLVVVVPRASWFTVGDTNLELREGLHSESRRLYPGDDSTKVIPVFESRQFYIHLNSTISDEDAAYPGPLFGFVYDYNIDSALNRAADLHKKFYPDQYCPFKNCFMHRCKLYWETCSVAFDDDLCAYEGENNAVKECPDYSGCYNTTLDYCDLFYDCKNGVDEDCASDFSRWTTLIVIVVVGILLFSSVKFGLCSRFKRWFLRDSSGPSGHCCKNTLHRYCCCCCGCWSNIGVRCFPCCEENSPNETRPRNPSATEGIDMESMASDISTPRTTANSTAGIDNTVYVPEENMEDSRNSRHRSNVQDQTSSNSPPDYDQVMSNSSVPDVVSSSQVDVQNTNDNDQYTSDTAAESDIPPPPTYSEAVSGPDAGAVLPPPPTYDSLAETDSTV